MNTTFLRTTVSTTLLLSATLAFADHNAVRELEDKAFTALTQAREIRLEVRDHFEGSASYDLLIDESNKLYRSSRAIEESILCGKPANAVCREIDLTLRALQCFNRNLEASDFACNSNSHHRTTHRGNGYTFRAGSRSPGYVHVVAVRQMVANLESTLSCLHDDLSQLSDVRPAPRAPFPTPLPAYPHSGRGGHYSNPETPAGPFLPPPSASRSRSTIDLPVNMGNRGGIVFRFPMN